MFISHKFHLILQLSQSIFGEPLTSRVTSPPCGQYPGVCLWNGIQSCPKHRAWSCKNHHIRWKSKPHSLHIQSPSIPQSSADKMMIGSHRDWGRFWKNHHTCHWNSSSHAWRKSCTGEILVMGDWGSVNISWCTNFSRKFSNLNLKIVSLPNPISSPHMSRPYFRHPNCPFSSMAPPKSGPKETFFQPLAFSSNLQGTTNRAQATRVVEKVEMFFEQMVTWCSWDWKKRYSIPMYNPKKLNNWNL